MDFLFEGIEDEEDNETEEERIAREAKEEAEREEQRLLRNAEMDRAREERLARKKAEEERWYPKQQRVLELEDYFEQHSVLLLENDKREFHEFLPTIVELIKKDANMMSKMEAVKDEQGLKSLLTTWYFRLKLGEREMERVGDWLEKFEKNVMGALRQRINIKAADSSQRVFTFFRDLKEKELHRRMMKIRADDIAKKIEVQKKNHVTDATRKTLTTLDWPDLPDEVIAEMEEWSRRSVELRNQGPSSEPVRLQYPRLLRQEVLTQLAEHFVRMDLSEQPNQVSSDDEEDDDDDVQVMDHKDIPDVIDWSRDTPENRPKSINYDKASETQRKEHRRRRFQDARAKSVKFVDYKSPKNTMRIFVKPNGYISRDADDGPTTDFVDLSLKEGHEALAQFTPPHTAQHEHVRDHVVPSYFGRKKLVAFKDREWLQGYSGNLLGRFWIIRKNYDLYDDRQLVTHSIKASHGLLHDYDEVDMRILYSDVREREYKEMFRSNRRAEMPISGQRNGKHCDPMNGVLLLTDWRLFFLDNEALVNATVRFMPTNIGNTFFEFMTAYLVELIKDPNLEIHTIIFAFGGSPMFKKEAFNKFWRKLIKETLKSIDVVWTAQDWLDGKDDITEEDREQLTDFNNYVRKVFEIMHATGHRNYKFCNIREKYRIPMEKLTLKINRMTGSPDVSPLQTLYFAYMDWLQSACFFHCGGVYFTNNKRKTPSYKENCGRYPRPSDIYPETRI